MAARAAHLWLSSITVGAKEILCVDAGAAPQYALANAASGLSSRLPMSAHPPASAALISKVLAMLSLAARPRPTVLATAASGCDVMLHASRHHAAALALSSGVVRLLASSRRAAGSACTSAWVCVSTAGLFCDPGLVLVRDAVWHVVVCSQYRHDRGGL